MVTVGRCCDRGVLGLDRCVHENFPAVAWTRDRPDGTPTIDESRHGIADSFCLCSLSPIPLWLLLVLASFEPSESRDRSVAGVRKLAGNP